MTNKGHLNEKDERLRSPHKKSAKFTSEFLSRQDIPNVRQNIGYMVISLHQISQKVSEGNILKSPTGDGVCQFLYRKTAFNKWDEKINYNFACEILSPGIWNSKGSSSKKESNPVTIGIRNLISTERLTKNPESRAWNPESKTVP